MRENKDHRCIIAGVDPTRLPFAFNEDSKLCQEIKGKILNAVVMLSRDGVEEFYSDCSYGFPLWGAEVVTGLMMYNDIKFYAVQPHENQTYKYDANWGERYHKVHQMSTDVIPMYVRHDTLDEAMTFYENRFENQSGDENRRILERKAVDYMLEDCGRLLFCGDGFGCYIYEQALRNGLKVTAIKTHDDEDNE